MAAQPSMALMPDGQSVPMWGYACGTVTGATCAAANPNASGGWSPVIITVAPGNLTINLLNTLRFQRSLVIVGQVGGGLGTGFSAIPSPPHPTQTTTWPSRMCRTRPTPRRPQPSRIQSFATEVAPGTSTTPPTVLAWTGLKPGTYLLESGTHPSIQGPMGLYGVVVVTTLPSGTIAGTAYPGVSYNAEVPLVLSEIDPVQNAAVAKAVTMSGFSETAVWSGQPGQCGDPNSTSYGSCYPPAVNYSPLYYLINGVSLDRTNLSNSIFPVNPTTGVSGQVLVRLVNAGLRMHVPSIVGATTGAALRVPRASRSLRKMGTCSPACRGYRAKYSLQPARPTM